MTKQFKLLLEQRENRRRRLIGLRQHRCGGLLNDLRASQFCRGGSVVCV
jgi:hypothetical protein